MSVNSMGFDLLVSDGDEDMHLSDELTDGDTDSLYELLGNNGILLLDEEVRSTTSFVSRSDSEVCMEKGHNIGEVSSQRRGMSQRLALNPHKAGMEGVDKEMVNKTIYEASKDSKFFNNQLSRNSRTKEKVKRLVEDFARLKESGMLGSKSVKESVHVILDALEKQRDLSRVMVHCDMDAFYASVEELDDPTLRNIPMAVGGEGMLTTCNYVARKFGVRSAMPGYIARKLCPELKIVVPRFERYKEISEQVKTVFTKYDPNFMSAGLDEAYIDITKYLTTLRSVGNLATAEETVAEMRAEILRLTGVSCSAGISANTLLSKVCSDLNKPNGQYSLPRTRDAILEFIFKLNIRKISGIGKVSEQILNGLGIFTCGDIYNQLGALYILFKESTFGFFARISLGIGSADTSRKYKRKSVGRERSFREQSCGGQQMETCERICKMVATDLKRLGLKGRTVTLKLKFIDFTVLQRSKTLSYSTSAFNILFQEASSLLAREQLRGGTLRLRLLGVRMTSLTEAVDESSSLTMSVQRNITSYFGNKPTFIATAKPQFLPKDDTLIEDSAYNSAIPHSSYSNNEHDSNARVDGNVHHSLLSSEGISLDQSLPEVGTTGNILEDMTVTTKTHGCDRNDNPVFKSIVFNNPCIDNIASPMRDNTAYYNLSSNEDMGITNDLKVQHNVSSMDSPTKTHASTHSSSSDKCLSAHSSTCEILCPLCQVNLFGLGNILINQHIDLCLNRDQLALAL
eukprot:CFRG2594T1